jgi:hypothetical protein
MSLREPQTWVDQCSFLSCSLARSPLPNPPASSWPPFKPSHGICCFTTMTFGAHRGADRYARRSVYSDGVYDSSFGSARGLWPRPEARLAQLRQ